MRFKLLIVALVAILASVIANSALALAITSAATGNWNALTTWSTVTVGVPGTITSSTASATVTGVGTQFNELAAGDQLLTTGDVVIGTILSVSSNTSLTLSANAAVNLAGVAYRIRKVPNQFDDVTIGAPHNIGLTANAAAASITVTGGNHTVSLNGFTMNVGGAVVMSAPTTNVISIFDVGAGTLNAASISLTGGGANRVVRMTINTGTITTTGSIAFAGTAGNTQFISTGASTVNVGGDFGSGGTLTTSGTGTINFNGSAAQIIGLYTTYNNIAVNNTSATAGQGASVSAGTTIIGGTLTVSNGSLNIGDSTFTVAGATSIDSGGMIRFITSTTGAKTFTGNVILNEGGTWNNIVNEDITLSSNFTNNGTFASGSGLYTFDGAAAQTITRTLSASVLGPTIFGGSVTAANGLILAGTADATVTATLTLSAGQVATGANTLYIASGNAITGPAVGGGIFVVGNLRKPFTPTSLTATFEVGTTTGADKYAPVTLTFASITTAGDVTISTTYGDHAQIATSGIDATKHVNRYWSVKNTGLVFTSYSATFRFAAGAPPAGDIDAIANTALFIASRYDGGGAAWNPITVSANTATTIQISGETGFGDYVVGEQLGVSSSFGRFNAYDATGSATISGTIRTKLAGSAFTLTVVHLSTAGSLQNLNDSGVLVELLDGSDNSGALDANACRTTWTILSPPVSQTVNFSGSSQTATFTVAKAYRNVRVRVTNTNGSQIGCSADNFSIRPTTFTITSTNAIQTDSAGTPAIKTGANFNLVATAVVGYDGVPSIDNAAGMVSGTPIAGTLGGSFGAASPTTGIATGANFYYTEVGNFGLAQNAIYDSSFTSVDQPTGCTADFSNTAVSNLYGCSFGSTEVPLKVAPGGSGGTGFGRFIPDNFSVSYNSPAFGAACGSFTYTGQRFDYTTAPIITVTARNGINNGLTNAVTTNYAGDYAKLTNASLAPTTQAARYSRVDALAPPAGNTPALDTSGLPAIAADPAIGDFVNGVGTLTFSSGTGLLFARGTAARAPFNADIVLAVDVIDTDAVAFAGNPAQFGVATAGNGIAFSGGNKTMRFGKLQLSNAHGSELLNLPIPIGTEYWNGTTFIPNVQDNCTLISSVANITFGNYQGGIDASNMASPANVNLGGVFISGKGSLLLTKPTPQSTTKGSVDITLNLTAENKTYLQSGPAFGSNPTVRATFGIYKRGPIIYMREMY